MYLVIDKADICMAKYISSPVMRLDNQVVCGSCNLSFTGKHYIKCYINKDKYRYISNCPHCGKWNKIKVITH
jgi:transcription elongation factor Elf1